MKGFDVDLYKKKDLEDLTTECFDHIILQQSEDNLYNQKIDNDLNTETIRDYTVHKSAQEFQNFSNECIC